MTTAVQPLAGAFTADPDHSSFQAALRHMGVGTFRTGFHDVQARLEPTAHAHRLVGSAKVASIDIQSPPEFRAHVVEGADFFDAGNHPEITFTSRELRLDESGAAELRGTLTIKGIEKEVSARGAFRPPVEDIYGKLRAALDLTATIDRRDWGMDFQAQLPGGGDVLSWAVELSVHLELVADGS
jgi:polyisoprenoid-binding protein YceI